MAGKEPKKGSFRRDKRDGTMKEQELGKERIKGGAARV